MYEVVRTLLNTLLTPLYNVIISLYSVVKYVVKPFCIVVKALRAIEILYVM